MNETKKNSIIILAVFSYLVIIFIIEVLPKWRSSREMTPEERNEAISACLRSHRDNEKKYYECISNLTEEKFSSGMQDSRPQSHAHAVTSHCAEATGIDGDSSISPTQMGSFTKCVNELTKTMQ